MPALELDQSIESLPLAGDVVVAVAGDERLGRTAVTDQAMSLPEPVSKISKPTIRTSSSSPASTMSQSPLAS